MAKYTVKTKIKWNGNEAKLLGKKYIDKSLLEAGIIIQNQAVVLCPVDQGRLRGSIFLKMKNYSRGNAYSNKALAKDLIDFPSENGIVYVGTCTEYGPYVEYGTWKMNAQPFIRPSFDIAQNKVLTLIKSNGKTVFKDYLKT